MKFLTILATVFCGGTFWVNADYYIEYRAPPQFTNARGITSLTNYLFECKGPNGTPAYTAVMSRCTQVTSRDRKIEIYSTCNFFGMHRPDLQNHEIQLLDRPFTRGTRWSLGYLNHAMDHPNFAAPSEAVIAHFRHKVQQLGMNDFLSSHLTMNLAVYFAQANLIALSESPVFANNLFDGFSTLLRNIMEQARAIHQGIRPGGPVVLAASERAIKFGLAKMIDPCSVFRGDFQAQASHYCATYCNFLRFASRHFNIGGSRCSTLLGGHCVTVVCTCVRALVNPLAGCDATSTTSPMLLCYNSMREEVAG